MTLPTSLVGCLVCTLLSAGLAHSQVEFDPLGREIPIEEMPKIVRVQVDWIEIDHLTMSRLLSEEAKSDHPSGVISSNSSDVRSKLDKMIEGGKARLVESSVITARSGETASVESITEQIYPTEYEYYKRDDKDTEENEFQFYELPVATAFETRNVGVTLEVAPNIGVDNRVVDISLAPELIYMLEPSTWGFYKDGDSEVNVELPTFYKVNLSTASTVHTGEPFLLGCATPHDVDTGKAHPNKRMMVFMKCVVQVAGLPMAKEEGSE